MTKLEMFQRVLAEVGAASPEQLSLAVEQRFGFHIEPRFIPVFRASIRDQERQAERRCRQVVVTRGPAAVTPAASAAQALALELMRQHRLHDWHFAFNRRKQTLGLCIYQRKTIELSLPFVERNPAAEVRDTILHEIAHALVGPRHGHDLVWKRKCIELGARPVRCGDAEMPDGRWQACCGGCGRKFQRYRRPKRLRSWFCRTCGPEDGKLLWVQSEEALDTV